MVRNGGAVASRFRFNVVTGGGLAGGVQFSNANLAVTDLATGAVVTPQILDGSYAIPMIAPNSNHEYRFQLTVPDGVDLGIAGVSTIRFYPITSASATADDVVYLRAWTGDAASFKSDGWIQADTASAAIGNDILFNQPKPDTDTDTDTAVNYGLTDRMHATP